MAARLRQFGFSARRGQQFRGGPDSPDVICEELDGTYHFEMKWGYRGGLSVRTVLKQAAAEAPPGAAPIGVWKPQHEEAIGFMYLTDLLLLLKCAEEEGM